MLVPGKLEELIFKYGDACQALDWSLSNSELDDVIQLKTEACVNLINYIEANYVPID